jgi:uncharacterized protein YdiU (UPF0061 family)
MNILKNLFGVSRKTAQIVTRTFSTPETTVAEAQQEYIPPVDLFIDNEVPQPELQAASEVKSKISIFLDRNYHSLGINDGYEYHSQETLETGKKKIRAEFQLIIDQAIQEKFARRLQLKNMIVDVKSIFDDARQKLENTIEELNASLAILQKQKELSAENEGWVMNSIHNYHQGFIQGLNDWISSEQLLNSIKII